MKYEESGIPKFGKQKRWKIKISPKLQRYSTPAEIMTIKNVNHSILNCKIFPESGYKNYAEIITQALKNKA